MGKQFKDAAAAATPVYNRIIGAAQNVQDAENVKDVQATQGVRAGRNAKYTGPMERLNLKIPAELKAYLQAAAYKASSPTRTVSPTEYLCKLLKEDMERNSEDGDSL